MDLREYMFRKRMTIPHLCKLMDCSRQQIGLVKAGKPVSKKFARQLERITDGEVTVAEIVTSGPIPFPTQEPEQKEEELEEEFALEG